MAHRICCSILLLLSLCAAKAHQVVDISLQNGTFFEGQQEFAGTSGQSFAMSRVPSRLGCDPPPYDLIILEPTGAVADSVLIILHGATQFAEQNLFVAQVMRSNGLGTTRFILPQAPIQQYDFFDIITPSWYNVMRGPNGEPVLVSEAELAAVASNIDSIAEVQRTKFGIPANKIAVLGISQGGGVALTLFLRFKVAACVGWSTWLTDPESYPDALTDDSAIAPLLMLHGRIDTIVPIQLARNSRDVIASLERSVRLVEFPFTGHFLLGVLPIVFDLSIRLLLEALQGP